MYQKQLKYRGEMWRLFQSLPDDGLPAFFLDSSLYHKELGRFSFMGWAPRAVFRSRQKKIEYWENGRWSYWEDDPLKALEEVRKSAMRSSGNPGLFPFSSGLVGYLAYDMGKNLEEIKIKTYDDLNLYDQYWGVYGGIVAFDNLNKETWIVAESKLEACRMEEEINSPFKTVKAAADEGLQMGEISSNFARSEYLIAVKKVKEHIRVGDIYQAYLSQRFNFELLGSTLDYYGILRRLNPSHFGAFLRFSGFDILSMSPERFIKITGNTIETRPIKGTRPRGRDAREDQVLSRELRESIKDQAELLMIVDLERNDLGRICQPGSIAVEDLFRIAAYADVIHMDASVSGVLKDHTGIDEVLRSTFPGGSITGAPKIMAMNIIEDLEPTVRGVYTGCIGYIDGNGNCDLNIAIRTLLVKDHQAYYQAGGGLVADSDPEAEYDETLAKSRVLFAAREEVPRHADHQLPVKPARHRNIS